MVHETREPTVSGAESDAAATVADRSTPTSARETSPPVLAPSSLRSAVRGAARNGVKALAAAADLVRRPPAGLVVLIYHQVDAPQASAVNLTRTVFRDQLEYLRAQERVGPLDEGVAAVRRLGPPLHDPPGVVITFDDGTADFVDSALPELVRLQLPVTLYVATRWVEEGRSFWDDGTVLSWAGLRDAMSTGLVTIGSHTHSHALLDRVGAAEIADELDRSIGLIEDNLNVTPVHFAYPKALLPSPSADLAVRARFESAAIAGTRPNPYRASDPYLLRRSPIQVADGMTWFRRKSAGGLRLEDDVRGAVNRRRYAGAVR